MEQPTTVVRADEVVDVHRRAQRQGVFAGVILAIAAKHIWDRRKNNRYPFSDEDKRR